MEFTLIGGLTNVLPKKLRHRARIAAALGDAHNPELCTLMLGRRRRCFVDVGANQGIYSRAAASLYESCVVFEPIPKLAADLKRALPDNCLVQNNALSNFNGIAKFCIPLVGGEQQTELASLRQFGSNIAHQELEVEVKKLDDIDLTDVDFIKIDVEGGEYNCLLGAKNTIKDNMPILLIEIEDRHTEGKTKKVFDFLFSLKYSAYVLKNERLQRKRNWIEQFLRGFRYINGWATVDLVPVDQIISKIYKDNAELNFSIIAGKYTNNFVFLPPHPQELRYRTYERSPAEMPKPRSEWVVRQLKFNKLLDEDWYLRIYPDVASAAMDPVEHYEIHGRHEGRNPRQDFDTEAYLVGHPEVKASGENPLWHSFISNRDRNPDPPDTPHPAI